LGGAVEFGYANLAALNSADAIIVMLSYTLQLYFDFSGYCDMAMGIAGMFGINLPLNFNSPYKASNIMEFWQGWHITLTRFFTRYLYIPLGGNCKGKCRTYVNCLIVFLISGIWHGAGLTFVIWGLLHGILYVATRAWKDYRAEKGVHKQGKNKIIHGISVFLTFLYVNIAWIFFRAPSVGEAFTLIKTICAFRFSRINWNLAGCFNLDEFWYIIKVAGIDSWQYAHYILMSVLLLAMLFLVFFSKNAHDTAKRVKPRAISTIFITILFVWSVLSLSGVSSFLYVNF
ncbi:MAG: MBOAT family protein, partial [Lachnospiraceae bacterium]|nr:MBOAT family protein [Lachnospiraceae bacterium]